MWYKKGAEAKEALQRAEALSKALKEKGVPRFWLKPDEKADVIFVDDDGFLVRGACCKDWGHMERHYLLSRAAPMPYLSEGKQTAYWCYLFLCYRFKTICKI